MMKSSLLTLLLGFSVSIAFAQSDHMPPQNVSKSFQKEYPHSQPSQWSQSSVGWSVSFEDRDHNNGAVIAYFDGTGRHIDTHIPYENHDVPSTVRNHMHDNYGGASHYDYTRIDHEGERDVYRTQYKVKKHYTTVYLDKEGRERDYHDNHQ
jgi:hypothetical protein